MSHKLASAVVCVGIAVGSLSAPRASKSNAPVTTTLGNVNAPLSAVTGSVECEVSGRQPGHPATNAIEITFQQ